MVEKLIEVEIRAEVLSEDYDNLKRQLDNIGVLQSHTKRLSVMYFGEIGTKKIDVRVRITNGECEVVIKVGKFGSHNRTEIVQNINQEQFMGMVKIFSHLGFIMEIGERESFNYLMPDDITISLVSAGLIAYIELEKMSIKDKANQNKQQLKEIAKQLKLNLLNSEEEFNALCKRLSGSVDWLFRGTNEEYAKLAELFNHYKI